MQGDRFIGAMQCQPRHLFRDRPSPRLVANARDQTNLSGRLVGNPPGIPSDLQRRLEHRSDVVTPFGGLVAIRLIPTPVPIKKAAISVFVVATGGEVPGQGFPTTKFDFLGNLRQPPNLGLHPHRCQQRLLLLQAVKPPDR